MCVSLRSLPVSRQVWSLDTAKQGMSAGAAHVSGMLVAMVASHDGGDQCAFYLITFTIDTTLGVFIGYVLLKRLQALARSRGWDSLSSTGNYGTPVRYSVWAKQMVTWCLIVVIARACCGAIVYSLRHPLASFSEWLAAPFDGHPHLFLLVVMLACPVCMNVAQLWVQDTFLKKGGLLSRRRLRGGGDGGSYEVETEEIDPNAQAAGAMPSASASAGSAARIDVETAPLLAPAASTPRGDAAASSDAEMNAE